MFLTYKKGFQQAKAARTFKLVSVISNFLFLTIGFALISASTLILHIYPKACIYGVELSRQLYCSILCCAFGSGLAVLLVAVIGLFGIRTHNTKFLDAYMIVVSLFCVSAFVTGIVVSQYPEKIGKIMMQQYRLNSSILVRDSIDFVQKAFDCCGVSSPDEWVANNKTCFPNSCCKDGNDDCCGERSKVRPKPCKKVLRSKYEISAPYLIGAFCLLCVSPTVSILAVFFYKKLKDSGAIHNRE